MSKAKAKRSSASAAPPPKALIQAANSRANPLASLADFDAAGQCLWRSTATKDDDLQITSDSASDVTTQQQVSPLPPLELRIVCQTWAQLDPPTRQWMLDLTEANMADYYRASAWGWNRASKEGELRHASARHLLVYVDEDENGRLKTGNTSSSAETAASASSADKAEGQHLPIAFVHFRFEEGYADDATLYCYELQLVEGVRRRGIGATLMELLQQLATVHRMKKVLLTVLTGNTEAVGFYVDGLKFAVDRHSPSRFKSGPVDYEILSKKVVVVEEKKKK